MATALVLITDALKEIGVLAEGETPTAGQTTDALARLNRFLDRLAAENLAIYAVTRTTQAIVPSQASYTVGPSGNINIARPNFIERVNFIDNAASPAVEYPLPDPMTEQQWTDITIKNLTSPFPKAVYYSPTYPLGTLTPWPIPTNSNLLWVVYAWTAVAQIAAQSDTVALPPGYGEMIVQNLALLLCPTYERQPHPVLVKTASESMATVKRSNHRTTDRTFGADVRGDRGAYGPGGWSIYTGP